MFELTTHDDVVTAITFASDPKHGPAEARFGSIDHIERASALASSGARVASIVVATAPLESVLWEDPVYASWTTRVGSCEALAEAVHDQFNHFGPDEVHTRARELGFPEVSGSDEDDVAYHTAVFDAIVQERDLLAMLDVLDRERESCRFEWTEDDDSYDDEPVALDAVESERRWEQRRRELLAPQPMVERRRRYVLPAPLDLWDHRNAVQQWYFVESAEGIQWWQGGSGSSGQREDHGRWAHTFGALTVHHDVAVPTVVLRYDARNVLRLVSDSPSLLVDGADLVGNYAVDHAESKGLLKRYTIDARRIGRTSPTDS